MKKRFTEEQIIGFLREAEAGLPIKELCRRHGFSEAGYYLWRSKFGGMSVSDAKRLKELETENTRRKKLFAEAMLENEVTRGAKKKGTGSPRAGGSHGGSRVERTACLTRRHECQCLPLLAGAGPQPSLTRMDHRAGRSGSANLHSAISGNSGHDAGLETVWQEGVFDGQEIGAAHPPHPQSGIQGTRGLGCFA